MRRRSGLFPLLNQEIRKNWRHVAGLFLKVLARDSGSALLAALQRARWLADRWDRAKQVKRNQPILTFRQRVPCQLPQQSRTDWSINR